MITTEQFDTLLQEQAASGILTPIDSEQDLSEIRGGGGPDAKAVLEAEYDFQSGKWTLKGTLELSGNGGKLALTLTEEMKLKMRAEAERKSREQPKPAPAPGSGSGSGSGSGTGTGTTPKLIVYSDDQYMFARSI